MQQIQLVDVCVKNSGTPFLLQICSRDFLDPLESLLTTPPMFGGITNHDVKQKILALIQSWAFSVKDRPDCQHVVEVFNRMRNSPMYQFPQATQEETLSTFVDTQTAPEWTDSDTCTRCRVAFTFTNRKHHCRNCGKTFCQACSAKSTPILKYGIVDAVRVCEGCYAGLTSNIAVPPGFVPPGVVPYSVGNSVAPVTGPGMSGNDLARREEEELQRAIQLSLASTVAQPIQPVVQPIVQRSDLEKREDEELERAIQESLRISQQAQSISSYKPESASPFIYPTNPVASATVAPKQATNMQNPHAISETEKSNIRLFSSLVSQLQSSPALSDTPLESLYAQIAPYQSKLVREVDTTSNKLKYFRDLKDKLEGAMRNYDLMLQRRLTEATDGEYRYYSEPVHVYPEAQAYHPTVYSQEVPSYQTEPAAYEYAESYTQAPQPTIDGSQQVYSQTQEEYKPQYPTAQQEYKQQYPTAQEEYYLATREALNNAPRVPTHELPVAVVEEDEKPLIEL
jgi:growth factor-regulated tyrosine kinase substrate